MVNNLLKDGANLNLLDNYQNSPLVLAIQDNRTAIAQLLLQFSDRIDFKSAQI
jgi:ankyrin repeat protein